MAKLGGRSFVSDKDAGDLASYFGSGGDAEGEPLSTEEPEGSPEDLDEAEPEDKESMADEEAEHGFRLKKPLKSAKGKETPKEEAAEEREAKAQMKKHGAPKGKHKPWSGREKKSRL